MSITTETLVTAYAEPAAYAAWAKQLYYRFQAEVRLVDFPEGALSRLIAVDVADFLLRAIEDFPYNDPAEDGRFAKYLSIAAAAVTDPRGAGAVLAEAAA